jgi:hypothetical protein
LRYPAVCQSRDCAPDGADDGRITISHQPTTAQGYRQSQRFSRHHLPINRDSEQILICQTFTYRDIRVLPLKPQFTTKEIPDHPPSTNATAPDLEFLSTSTLVVFPQRHLPSTRTETYSDQQETFRRCIRLCEEKSTPATAIMEGQVSTFTRGVASRYSVRALTSSPSIPLIPALAATDGNIQQVLELAFRMAWWLGQYCISLARTHLCPIQDIPVSLPFAVRLLLLPHHCTPGAAPPRPESRPSSGQTPCKLCALQQHFDSHH